MLKEKHKALITGSLYKWEEYLHTKIDIENLLVYEPSPISKYSSSLKQFLHEVLIGVEEDTCVYFMAKVEAYYETEPKEVLEFELIEVNYMSWEYKC